MAEFRLKSGFAQIDITPDPKSVFMDGYGFRTTPAEGVSSRLYAKAFVVSSGEKLFVTVSMDVCGLNKDTKDYIRGVVKVMVGLKDDQFSISATHTHAGPALGVLDLPINTIYRGYLGKQVAEVIQTAIDNQTEGCFRFGFGDEFLKHPFNRRGKEIIDRRVPVCAFYDREGRLRGVIASASCHAVCNTTMLISADYPSVMVRLAEEKYPGVPFIFLQGRGADIDPIKEEENAGQEFASCVFAGLERLGEPLYEGEVKSLYRTVKLPMAYPSDEEINDILDTRKELLKNCKTEADSRFATVEMGWALKMKSAKEKGIEPSIDADLALMTVGKEWIIAFVSFELLTATGNALEAIFASYGISPEKCFIIGYSNANNGYLAPADEAGDPTYETGDSSIWYGLPYCVAETEKTVLATFEEAAKELLR